MLLAARLVWLPATDICERLFAPQRRAGLRQVPPRQQHPGIVRLRNRQKFAVRRALKPIDSDSISTGHVACWTRNLLDAFALRDCSKRS